MAKPKKDCKLCARVAPAKCGRHGGPKRHTKGTGGGTPSRPAAKPRATTKRALREAVSMNGANGARKAGQVFIDQLHRLRAELDEKIADVESLVGIL